MSTGLNANRDLIGPHRLGAVASILGEGRDEDVVQADAPQCVPIGIKYQR